MTQLYEIQVKAIGEVRDADGNLLSAEPVEATMQVPEEHLRASGLTDEQINQIKGEQK